MDNSANEGVLENVADQNTVASSPPASSTSLFPELEHLGNGVSYAEAIRRVVEKTGLLGEFDLDDLKKLGQFLNVFKSPAQTRLIEEGDRGDFMLFLISGKVEVTRRSDDGVVKRLAVVSGGTALGEMSMIDGDVRFASCTTVSITIFAVLGSEDIALLIANQPAIASRILMKLANMLSQRLRQTSAALLPYLNK